MQALSVKLISLIQALLLTLLGITLFRMVIGDISLWLFEFEVVFFLLVLFFLLIKAVLIHFQLYRLQFFTDLLISNILWARTTAILIENVCTVSEAFDCISLDKRVKRHHTQLSELAGTVRGVKLSYTNKRNKHIPAEIYQAFRRVHILINSRIV